MQSFPSSDVEAELVSIMGAFLRCMSASVMTIGASAPVVSSFSHSRVRAIFVPLNFVCLTLLLFLRILRGLTAESYDIRACMRTIECIAQW